MRESKRNVETKPKKGIYSPEDILKKSKGELPAYNRLLLSTDPKAYEAIKYARTLWRRRHNSKKYLRFGKRVLGIRKRMKKSQTQFALIMGVSVITIRRWENGHGHSPATWKRPARNGRKSLSNAEMLESLEVMLKDFKKKKIPLED